MNIDELRAKAKDSFTAAEKLIGIKDRIKCIDIELQKIDTGTFSLQRRRDNETNYSLNISTVQAMSLLSTVRISLIKEYNELAEVHGVDLIQ